MIIIIPYALIFLAAVFNAIMDRLENEPAFNKSVFRKKDARFWSKTESWKYVKKIFGYRPDGWHLAKSGMIICMLLAVIFAVDKHQWWVRLISMGAVWNLTFSLFYHKILYRK